MASSLTEEAAAEFVDHFIEIRRSIEPYKALMIEDGWSEDMAERVSADLIMQMNKHVLKMARP